MSSIKTTFAEFKTMFMVYFFLINHTGSHIKRQHLTPDLLRMIVKRLAQFSLTYQNII